MPQHCVYKWSFGVGVCQGRSDMYEMYLTGDEDKKNTRSVPLVDFADGLVDKLICFQGHTLENSLWIRGADKNIDIRIWTSSYRQLRGGQNKHKEWAYHNSILELSEETKRLDQDLEVVYRIDFRIDLEIFRNLIRRYWEYEMVSKCWWKKLPLQSHEIFCVAGWVVPFHHPSGLRFLALTWTGILCYASIDRSKRSQVWRDSYQDYNGIEKRGLRSRRRAPRYQICLTHHR